MSADEQARKEGTGVQGVVDSTRALIDCQSNRYDMHESKV